MKINNNLQSMRLCPPYSLVQVRQLALNIRFSAWDVKCPISDWDPYMIESALIKSMSSSTSMLLVLGKLTRQQQLQQNLIQLSKYPSGTPMRTKLYFFLGIDQKYIHRQFDCHQSCQKWTVWSRARETHYFVSSSLAGKSKEVFEHLEDKPTSQIHSTYFLVRKRSWRYYGSINIGKDSGTADQSSEERVQKFRHACS